MVRVLIRRKLAGMYVRNELLVKTNTFVIEKPEDEILKSGIEEHD